MDPTIHSADATPFERAAAAVIVNLEGRGVRASFEFPGTVVAVGDSAYVIAGDANAPRWGVDLYGEGDVYLDSLAGPDLSTPAAAVAAIIAAALEAATAIVAARAAL